MAKNVSLAQVHELLDQQKAFFKESLQQMENSYKSFVKSIMDNTNSRLDGILKDVEDLKVSLQYTQKDVDQLKETCNKLSSDCKSSEGDIHRLAESLLTMDYKSDYLDGQSRRNNLVIDGVLESDNEKWADTEQKVLKLFGEKLDLDPTKIEIERAHRTGKVSNNVQSNTGNGSSMPGRKVDRPRSIVVKFLRFKDRERVLWNANKLKGTKIFINEDYPEAVRQKRRELIPKMLEARKNGDYAVLRYDKLITRPGRQQERRI